LFSAKWLFSVKWIFGQTTFGQMVFRSNGLSVKWPFGQMVFGQMVFRSNGLRSKKFGEMTSVKWSRNVLVFLCKIFQIFAFFIVWRRSKPIFISFFEHNLFFFKNSSHSTNNISKSLFCRFFKIWILFVHILTVQFQKQNRCDFQRILIFKGVVPSEITRACVQNLKYT
jgi:hypothetical protein